jgi:hypothetical protein
MAYLPRTGPKLHLRRVPFCTSSDHERKRIRVVRDADHASFVDHPDVVMGAIETFLNGEWRRDGVP